MVYAGCDGGLFRSPDRGITWVTCNNGLTISEFEYLAQDCGLGALADRRHPGQRHQPLDGSPVWEHVEDADGGDVVVNRQNPAIVVHSSGMGRRVPLDQPRRLGHVVQRTPTRAGGRRAGSVLPTARGQRHSGDTVAPGGCRRSTSPATTRPRGRGWAFPPRAPARAVAVPDPDTVLVGLSDGRVLRTTFTAGAWSALTALTSPPTGCGHQRPGRHARWERADLGDEFLSAAGAGCSGPTTAARPGPTGRPDCRRCRSTPSRSTTWNGNRVWVAADLGVYQSWDGGASWADYSATLPNAFIGDLLFHPNARVLRAGTRNRGVWEIPVDGWMTQPICGTQWTGTLAGERFGPLVHLRVAGHLARLWTAMPTSPAPGAPQLTFKTQVERADAEHVTYWITVRNLTPARPSPSRAATASSAATEADPAAETPRTAQEIPMCTNVQFTGTLPAGATQRWFTFGWPAAWHVVWYMQPTTVRNGSRPSTGTSPSSGPTPTTARTGSRSPTWRP